MLAFFEGAAGTGKTHQLIERAERLFSEGKLENSRKLLALTYMNGSRRRLAAKLHGSTMLRGRYQCMTFDALARSIVARRKGMLETLHTTEPEGALNEFDEFCRKAARILSIDAVSKWVAAAYPVLLVDEAQDLDSHRLAILKSLAAHCLLLGAADEFQCLDEKRATDAAATIGWMKTAKELVPLTTVRRTSQSGIIRVASALRESHDVLTELSEPTEFFKERVAPGFGLVEVPGKSDGMLKWWISYELHRAPGQVAIITPNSKDPLIRSALARVASETSKIGKNRTIGPFQYEWELQDEDRSRLLLEKLVLPAEMTCAEASALLEPHSEEPEVRELIRELSWRRRLGATKVSSDALKQLIGEATRNISRHGRTRKSQVTVMTVQAAKNQEFRNVLVLWPQTVRAGVARRHLYNAITRAKARCTVIVIGLGRLRKVPFRSD